jgi:hypothetical protein
MLKEGKVSVTALGSFSDSDFNAFLLSSGPTQLIADVVRHIPNCIWGCFLSSPMKAETE